ncbi:hypothetical protein BCR16_11985 [Ralstonia solanacearum FJAT-1458]|nr:hypothetical protein BCR16_11985 [Ralstonia solanacearum FJAT-1458]
MLTAMQSMYQYFSAEHGSAFNCALPELRQSIASIRFVERERECDHGVAGNTFRAYVGGANPPSVIYRQWAKRVCEQLDPQVQVLAHQLSTAEGFRAWHTSLADSLQAHWVSHQRLQLSFAHQHKLIDLFVKWLSRYDFGCQQLSESFISHANCALDSQTLGKLNECLSMALPLSKPSMGHIHSEKTYAFCQSLIESFSIHYGGTRLLFDYFAWRPGGGR